MNTRTIEQLERELAERTQWQCACGGTDCAGQAENERLRVEHAETVRLLERAFTRLVASENVTLCDQIRAHLAAIKQPAATAQNAER